MRRRNSSSGCGLDAAFRREAEETGHGRRMWPRLRAGRGWKIVAVACTFRDAVAG